MVIDIRMREYWTGPPEAFDPPDRPGAGWKRDMTPQEVWECNRGYWKFGPRAWRERYVTFSASDNRVKCAARITGVTSVGVVPSKGERFKLDGEVLKPGDPEYDRLMNMTIPPHRAFRYIDDGTQLPAFTCLCGCGEPVGGQDQFISGHSQRAVQERIAKRWGGAAGFVKWFDSGDDA